MESMEACLLAAGKAEKASSSQGCGTLAANCRQEVPISLG